MTVLEGMAFFYRPAHKTPLTQYIQVGRIAFHATCNVEEYSDMKIFMNSYILLLPENFL